MKASINGVGTGLHILGPIILLENSLGIPNTAEKRTAFGILVSHVLVTEQTEIVMFAVCLEV